MESFFVLLGDLGYMGTAYILGAVTCALVIKLRPDNYRCVGIGSLLVVMLMLPLFTLSGFPLARLARVASFYAWPPIIISMAVTSAAAHILAPAAAPDFQTDSVGSSLLLGCATALGTVPAIMIFHGNLAFW